MSDVTLSGGNLAQQLNYKKQWMDRPVQVFR